MKKEVIVERLDTAKIIMGDYGDEIKEHLEVCPSLAAYYPFDITVEQALLNPFFWGSKDCKICGGLNVVLKNRHELLDEIYGPDPDDLEKLFDVDEDDEDLKEFLDEDEEPSTIEELYESLSCNASVACEKDGEVVMKIKRYGEDETTQEVMTINEALKESAKLLLGAEYGDELSIYFCVK